MHQFRYMRTMMITPNPKGGTCMVLLVLVTVLSVRPSFAQGLSPLGAEFQVSTSPTEANHEITSVSSDAMGRFAVVWDYNNPDVADQCYLNQNGGVLGQRFDRIGDRVGSEFQINASTSGCQRSPRISMAGNGDFVVVWQHRAQDSYYGPQESSIRGHRFSADGSSLGGAFDVAAYDGSQRSDPDLSISDSGAFTVVWQQGNIRGQQWDQYGIRVGSEFDVNTAPFSKIPRIAMSGDGAFVVVWRAAYAGPESSDEIRGQRFDPNANPLGGEFQVNTYSTGYRSSPTVAMAPDGRAVVAYVDHELDDEMLRIYDADGAPIGPEFKVSDNLPGSPSPFSIDMRDDGNFVVLWTDLFVPSEGESRYDLFAKYFREDGTVIGSEFLVRPGLPNSTRAESLTFQSEDEVVFIYHLLSPLEIKGRRVSIPMYYDGFESGDASGWTEVFP